MTYRRSARLLLIASSAAALVATTLTACGSAVDLSSKAADPPSGFTADQFDTTVRPQDDLFRHVNGSWLGGTEIPADKSRVTAFSQLDDKAKADVRAILERLTASNPKPGSEDWKLATLYTDFLNESAINEQGSAPLGPLLARIAAVRSKNQLATLLGDLQRQGAASLIATGVEPDAKNTSRYLLQLGQSGTLLPDKAYYTDKQFAATRAAYGRHVPAMLRLAGVVDPTATAASALDLETWLAGQQWTPAQQRNVEKSYNRYRAASLARLTPQFPWRSFAIGLQAPAAAFTKVIVGQPSFFTAMAGAWQSRPLSQWKNWLTWQVVHSSAPLLGAPLADENFSFFNEQLEGTQRPAERWQRAVALVQGAMGEAIGRHYVERHFPPDSKAQMESMVKAIVAQFAHEIRGLSWMSETTKTKALAKLDSMQVKIGYPELWQNYDGLTIEPGDVLDNELRANAFATAVSMSKLGQPVDRRRWEMLPQEINAYYSPVANEIVFPAGILQPPFFFPNADDAINYGAIGSVIGHEITHGFDDQGAKFDAAGNLQDWWTPADRKQFDRLTKRLADQYSQYDTIYAPGKHVNGELTLGENIADGGGLSTAAAAYTRSLGDNPAPVLDGLTGLQRVIFGWAQMWRVKTREAQAIQLLQTDPHSPGDVRANDTPRNVQVFYEALSVKPGDKLWMDPSQRVVIW